ncbi:MAG: serine hydrolase [Nitrospirae bacterium]|nr:serine hydrolase [Nitrospirota bacterium]
MSDGRHGVFTGVWAIGSKLKFHTLLWTASFLAVQLTLGCSDQGGPPPASANDPPQPNTKNSLVSYLDPKKLFLRSDAALVMDGREGRVLFEKKMYAQRPIASLTKLMTAMVILDAGLPEEEVITITQADRDRRRGSGSKLSFGTQLTRRDLLKIALAGSENRAAAALGRTYPGGAEALVAAMNDKAGRLGMKDTVFRDAAGLHRGNISTAADLVALVEAADRYPLIRELTTVGTDSVTDHRRGWEIRFVNTNRLVRNGQWNIGLSKTGYIAEAGHCLVMRAEIADRPIIVVLLNSWGEWSKYGDANRIRKWLDHADQKAQKTAQAAEKSAG